MPEPPLLQPAQLFETLSSHDVRYVLIGGLASTLHGSPLRTNDADICPARDPRNADRLANALGELDARIRLPDDPRGVSFPYDGAFLLRVGIWNLVTRFGNLDISFTPDGTDGFGDLRRAAVTYDVGGDVRVPVASLLDVIRSKEAAGREKDRQALPTLRRLLERINRDEPSPG